MTPAAQTMTPTDEEMAAWLNSLDKDAQSPVNVGWVRLTIADLIVLRAIAEWLRKGRHG